MSAQEAEWEVGEDSSNAGCAFIPVIRAADGWTICEIYADIELGITEEDRERTRLIAAAPDLLAALKALLADSYPVGASENIEVREQSIAAIAKAGAQHG